MVQIENDCVSCDLYCVNCGRKETPHYYCDNCGDETTLYEVDGKQLCADCLLSCFDKVEGSEE